MRTFATLALLAQAAASPVSIVTSNGAGQFTQLAASEVQRYFYVMDAQRQLGERVHGVADTRARISTTALTLTVHVHSQEEALLSSVCAPYARALTDAILVAAPRGGADVCVIGRDDLNTLYAAYDLLERTGVHFSTAGPAVPPSRSDLLEHVVSSLRACTCEGSDVCVCASTPVFTTRGLQPFHDFSEGPDWWSEDEHKRVLETIAAMKGNFIGFHTYPIDGPAEPAVWIGLAQDVNPDGTVNTGYPTTWSNTLRSGAWGYTPMNTSDFPYGASTLFEHECFGSPVQSGDADVCPSPTTEQDSITLFNRVGQLWQATFAYAHMVGVQNTIGTETPITPPPWSPTNDTLMPLTVWYSASRNDHFVTTTQCAECEGLYVMLGVEAWIYSGQMPNTIPLSTYYNGGTQDNMLTAGAPPAGYGFVRIEGYALPSGSGQPGTTTLQQMVNGNHHWAAAGAGITNATQAGFTNSGAIADVFSTGPPYPVGPSSQQWYEGVFTRLKALHGPNLDYFWVWTPEGWEWNQVNISNPLVQNVVTDTQAIQAAHDAVNASFQLSACGWVVGPLGARWYFDTVLPSSWKLGSIDMDVGNTDVDPAYANITHRTTANKFVIPWAEDDPGLTAPELWVNRTLNHCNEAVNYSVGGLMIIHWRTRMTSPQISAAHQYAWNPALTTAAFWPAWAQAQFGSSIATQAATIFSAIESFNLPRPVNWIGGPGGIAPGSSFCTWPVDYAFVDAFVALRAPLVAAIQAGQGDLSQLERFDYWGNQFVYMRSIARMECDWNAYNGVIAGIQKITDPTQRQQAAQTQGFNARISLVTNVTNMMWDLMASMTGIDTAGTIHNVVTHSLYEAVGDAPTRLLESLAGEPLPPQAMPPMTFDPSRAPSVRVQTVRSMLAPGEPLRMRAIVLTSDTQSPTNVTLFSRALGSNAPWSPLPLTQAAPEAGAERYVYTGTLPAPAASIEWYIAAMLPPNATAYTGGLGVPAGTFFTPQAVVSVFPPTAPTTPQTVILLPSA